MKVWVLVLIVTYSFSGTTVEKTDINFTSIDACEDFIKENRIDRGKPKCVESIIPYYVK